MNVSRWALYGTALLGAAALALFGDKTPLPPSEAEVVGATTAPRRNAMIDVAQPRADVASSGPPGAAETQWIAVRPRQSLWHSEQSRLPIRDIFALSSSPPAPKPPPSAPALPPQAPPLPFTFLGKRSDGTQWQVFLGRGDQTLIVQEGSTIEGAYRIDAVKPPTLTMTYLPLAQTQTLTIGGVD